LSRACASPSLVSARRGQSGGTRIARDRFYIAASKLGNRATSQDSKRSFRPAPESSDAAIA